MKNKLYIFDLDGVLIDSKQNMQLSWNYVQKKFSLKQNFNKYFQHIGKPFNGILKDLNIKNKTTAIYKSYNSYSSKNEKKIKIYKDVKNTLYTIKKNNLIAIVTSKNRRRTISILDKYKLKFDCISTPNSLLKGKPHPDQINFVIRKLRISKKNTVYIGDTEIDYLCAKKAKVDFIYAKYGYGKLTPKKNILSINSIKKVLKYKFNEKN
ncbi:HAD-IA family hydrolase [Candidatus Pelagibacter sp.]|nr:HAD-IA family hydrolase [Candidatus Pelagibacter sp.]